MQYTKRFELAKCIALMMVLLSACNVLAPAPTLVPPTATPMPTATPTSIPVQFYLDRGIEYVKQGDFERALADYDQAIRLAPDLPVGYIARGGAYLGQSDWNRAIQDFDQAIKLWPDDADAYFKRGLAYAGKGDLDHALADWDKAIQLDPDHADAYYQRGFTYAQKGDLDRAIADYDKAIQLKPDHTDAYFDRASAYVTKGDLDRAIADLGQAITLKPDDAKAYALRGACYSDQGDLEHAISDLSQAITLDSDDADAYFWRGNAYHDTGDYDRAIADYDQATRIEPDYAEAYVERGLTYREKGDIDRAIADYDKAIQIKPDLSDAYLNRGAAYQRQGDYDRAIADYGQVLKLKPDDAMAYANRGLTYKAKGDTSRAIADFKRVLEVSTDPDMRKQAEEQLKALQAPATSARTNPGLIAYSAPGAKGVDIYTVKPDGTQVTRLVQGQDIATYPRWSPDGRFIAYVNYVQATKKTDLWVIDLRARNRARAVTQDGKWLASEWSWASDGSALVFWGLQPNGAESDIYRLDMASGQVTDLTADHPFWDAFPVWSPDGQWIAFVSNWTGTSKGFDEICIMRPDGSDFKKLTDNEWEDEYPAWSPDGKRIAFLRFSFAAEFLGTADMPGGPGGIWIMDADGRNPRLVVKLKATLFRETPVWSPDGKYIAFIMPAEGAKETDVWVVPSAGGEAVNVSQTPGAESLVSWSPDSRALIFTNEKDKLFAQWIVAVDGSGKHLLLGSGRGAFGHWSP